jgi:hypothetical protein
MRFLAAAALLSFVSLSAEAACTRPTDAPVIPNGQTAEESEVKASREAVQAYVNRLEAYSACLKAQVAAPPEGTSIQERTTWIAQGEAAIDAAQMIAKEFSITLRNFKERAGSQAK